MIEGGLKPRSRPNPYGKRINREPSPLLANTVPYATIILGSILPLLLVTSTMPIIPPLGFMMLVGWRLMRPGLLPSWAGLPLGAIDDLFSGQPFGSAILLWSMTMLAIEWFETRVPWRGFLQDWLAAALACASYIIIAAATSGVTITPSLVIAILPQLSTTVLAFPMISGLVATFDRLRLQRIRKVG